ncbi:MAG: phosphate ABC transporter substrate-binding protein PstS [Acidobacteriota bacterium]|nr:phosphate ABC transporter substrate-binding protein PstS [Acidobacteriota bacterium]
MQPRTPLVLIALALAGVIAPALVAESITGAGATFPYPVYGKWFDEYHKLHSDVQINYQSIGSGGGIRQVTEGTVDFGASDVPMTDEQLSKSKVKILHFPTVMGADVPTYNLPGVTKQLRFSGETLAAIFLGQVKKWNDAKIKADNPGVSLPDAEITVVHRSEGSGTTFIWTDYLSKVSSEWKSKVGAGASVNWPVGLGGKGNEGVSGLVKQTPNSIGYVELIYAVSNKMAYGSVKNSAGNYVLASLASVTEAAAAAAKSMPDDFRVSITNDKGKGAYPISSFTWLLVPSKIANAEKKKEIKDFLAWMLGPGQKLAPGLEYAPLPKEVVAKESKQIALIQ